MKKLLLRVMAALLPLIPVQSLKAENEFDPYAPLVATDIWTYKQDNNYHVRFTIANTTGKNIYDYGITFVPSFLPMDSVEIVSAQTDALLAGYIDDYHIRVTPKTVADTLTGFLASFEGDTLSDPFLLFNDPTPIIETDAKTATCFYLATDNGSHLYYFSIWANNPKPYDVNGFCLYLNQATDDGKTIQVRMPVERIKAGDRKYFATVLSFGADARNASLWMSDERGVRLTDTMQMELPDNGFDAEDFAAPNVGADLVATVYLMDEDYIMQDYMGDSLRAGIITFAMPLYSGRPADQFIWPETAKGYLEFKDLYGHRLVYLDPSVADFVEDNPYSLESYSSPSVTLSLLRGGDYEYTRYMDFLGIDTKDTLRVYDDATIRYHQNYPAIGDPLSIRVAANTGYPYADSLKTCSPVMDYDLIYIQPVSGHEEGDTIDNWRSGKQTLNFNLNRYPTLAGTDTVQVYLDDPDIGDYWLHMKSDFKHHDKMAHIQVVDTVRMELELEKDSLRKGIDTHASVKYSIDYRWPYVVPENGDTIPTVRFYATCYRDSLALSSADSLICDSLRSLKTSADSIVADSIINANTIREYYVNDSLIINVEPYTFLHEEGSFRFNIEHLPVNQVNSVEFTVRFNGEEKKRMPLDITLNQPVLEVEEIEADALATDDAYDLGGRKISDMNRRGIYIRKGKKYILR